MARTLFETTPTTAYWPNSFVPVSNNGDEIDNLIEEMNLEVGGCDLKQRQRVRLSLEYDRDISNLEYPMHSNPRDSENNEIRVDGDTDMRKPEL